MSGCHAVLAERRWPALALDRPARSTVEDVALACGYRGVRVETGLVAGRTRERSGPKRWVGGPRPADTPER